MKKIITVFALLVALQLTAQETKKVLFLGNSYTSYNNLPGLIGGIAAANGDNVVSDQNIPGGATFTNHSTNATTLSKIKSKNWDYVVIQGQSQEPSFPPNQVEAFTKPPAKILVDSINASSECTKTLFYMTWGRKNGDASNCANYTPLCTYDGMQQRLRETYLEITAENDAECAPVGMAWKKVREDFPSIELYNADASHPSIEGSYLAACVIYTSIFHKSTVGNTYISSLDSTTAFRLQTIASATVLDSLDVWQIDTNAVLPSVINTVITACDSVEANGTWFYNDTVFSDTTIINDPCDIAIVNYSISIHKGKAEILDFNQVVLLKSEEMKGIYISYNAQNFDSLILYNNDTIVEVFYQNNGGLTYNCGNDVSNEMEFTLVAINQCSMDSLSKTFICTGFSSINNLSLNNWKISPNPTNHFIDISSADNEKFTTSLFDVSGRQIIDKTSETRLDLSVLEKGLYFVVLYNEAGFSLGQKRIIKN